MYPVQVSEYIAHTGDKSILKEVGGVLERIVAVFDSRVEENGLIANFPAPYWNFYEWSEGSSHSDEIGRTEKDGYVRRYDLILNCMYVHARKIYARLTGGTFDEKPALDAIHKAFFDGETGMYRLSTEGKLFSRLATRSPCLSARRRGSGRKDGKGRGNDRHNAVHAHLFVRRAFEERARI